MQPGLRAGPSKMGPVGFAGSLSSSSGITVLILSLGLLVHVDRINYFKPYVRIDLMYFHHNIILIIV